MRSPVWKKVTCYFFHLNTQVFLYTNILYNLEATRAQGEEVGGNEAEATEHDLSTTASADPNSESGQLNTVEVSVIDR